MLMVADPAEDAPCDMWVPGAVQVSWVQPRVLTLPQIEGLSNRLSAWVSKVSSAAMTLEGESIGVVSA